MNKETQTINDAPHANNTAMRSLAAHYYTSPDIYAKEQRTLMATTWQFAGHLAQLQNPGDYFVFTVADESCFCIRGQDGEVRAFYNVCQHRAHQLLAGAGNAKNITCPYHSWTYQTDGAFKSAPNIRAVADFDADNIRLRQIRSEEFCGFVFINLDDEAKPMDAWFPNARPQLREFAPNINNLAPLLWVEVPEHCNWKVSVENYSECYHCQTNHRAFTNGIIKPDTYDIQPQGFCLRHTTECQNLQQMSYPIDLSSNARAGEYSSWFLWPMFSFQVYPGNVLNTYHWRPLDVDKVIVWRGWYTAGGEESATIRALAKQDRETTVEEDISLVESVARGLKSRGYRPGPLVLDPKCGLNSEHSVRVLQQWVRDAIGV